MTRLLTVIRRSRVGGGDRKVVLLSPAFLGKDGVSVVARRALVAMQDAGLSVVACSLHESSRDVVSLAGVVGASGSRSRMSYWAACAVAGLDRESLMLSLHLHLAPVALPWKALGGRVAVFVHGVEAWKTVGTLRLFALMSADVVACNSRYTWRRAVEANPLLSRRSAEVCHLGVGPTVGRGHLLPGLVPGYVLIVGRMHERYKGHDELLDAWPSVLTVVPTARLVIAGDGPDRARLMERAISGGMISSVFFTGRVSDDELEALYRESAFFAMPSRGEGFGLVFLEAMRARKACVGGTGAAEEVIEHGQTGIIVDPSRPEDLIAGLCALLRDSALRDRMGHAGYHRWIRTFSAAQFDQRILACLRL